MSSWYKRVALAVSLVAVSSVIVVPVASAAPTNDDLDGALLITDGYAAALANTDATLETGEADGSCEYLSPDWSTWYEFTATATGNVWLQNRMPAPNTTNFMTVYELAVVGPPHTLGTEVACSAGANVNTEVVAVTSGTSYVVRVSGAASDLGDDVTLEFETMGTLSGTVTEDGTGTPLSGMSIEVLIPNATKLLASTNTIGDGTWTVDAATQNVIVRFSDPGAVYGTEYYDNVALKFDATQITVLAGATHSNIDAVMADAGSMSGTITSSGGGGIDNAAVSIYASPTPGSPIRTATADANGDYSLTGVAPGDYFVHFSHPDHFAEWYDSVSHWSTGGTAITINAGFDTDVDAVLNLGGSISGTVNDDLGQPIEDVTVEIFSSMGVSAGSDATDAAGGYSFRGLDNGTYAVFADSDTASVGAYGSEWWDDLPKGAPQAAVDKIVVSPGSADVADFALDRSQIHGNVQSATDLLAIEGVVVTVRDSLSAVVAQTTTDASGDFSLSAFSFTGATLGVHLEATSVFFVDRQRPLAAFAPGDVWSLDVELQPDPQPPVITDTTLAFDVPEDSTVGASVVDLTATDDNRADTIAWSITAGNTGNAFTIDEATGEITTAMALDYETVTAYSLTVKASDGGLDDIAQIDIDVLDVFDPPTFSDVLPGDWFYASVEAIAAAGITDGYPDGTFRPGNTLTRAEIAAFLIKALGETPTSPTVDPFTDVPTGQWYAGYVDRLKQLGITSGYPDGTYRPLDTVSRAETAAFLIKALGETPTSPTVDPFTDVPTGQWYTGYVDRLKQLGITSGYPDGTYRPANTISRAEIAAFLERAFIP